MAIWTKGFLHKFSRRAGYLLMGVGGFIFLVAAVVGLLVFTTKPMAADHLSGCFTSAWHKVYVCPAERSYLPLKRTPDHLKWAILLSEDAGFYQHSGFDWFEIKVSLEEGWENLRGMRGASTLSQQLVKNVFLSGERTITRKLREAYLTYQLEKKYSKNQILETYLNVVELGQNLFGFERAAHHYFGVSASDLSPTQSAFLASLLPNPKNYQAHLQKFNAVHPRQLEQIQRVLNRLTAHGRVPESYKQVLSDRIAMNFWNSFTIYPKDEALI